MSSSTTGNYQTLAAKPSVALPTSFIHALSAKSQVPPPCLAATALGLNPTTTEEGAELIRRQDAEIDARMRAELDARAERNRGPAIAYEIPGALYDKAEKHQDQLTNAERDLLLSRGDIYGKALAHPELLSQEERYQVMGWPPPEVARHNIWQVTGGERGEPKELFAKAREASQREQNLSSLSPDEIMMIVHGYWDKDNHNPVTLTEVPGNKEAINLIKAEEGIDAETFMQVLTAAGPIVMRRMQSNRDAFWARLNRPPPSATNLGPSLQAHIHPPTGSTLPLTHGPEFTPSPPSTFQFPMPLALAPGANGGHAVPSQGIHPGSQLRPPYFPYDGDVFPSDSPTPTSTFSHSRPAIGNYQPQGPLPPGIVRLAPRFTAPFPGGPAFAQADLESMQAKPPSRQRANQAANYLPWPPAQPPNYITPPLKLFIEDLEVQLGVESLVGVFDDLGKELGARWDNLTAEERAAYEAKSEALRQKAWTEFEENWQLVPALPYDPAGYASAEFPNRFQ